MGDVMKLHEEILNVLIKKSVEKYEYINPNFLSGINTLLWDYYNCEDDGVNEWISDMFGA